jgi:hypothetical protein
MGGPTEARRGREDPTLLPADGRSVYRRGRDGEWRRVEGQGGYRGPGAYVVGEQEVEVLGLATDLESLEGVFVVWRPPHGATSVRGKAGYQEIETDLWSTPLETFDGYQPPFVKVEERPDRRGMFGRARTILTSSTVVRLYVGMVAMATALFAAGMTWLTVPVFLVGLALFVSGSRT